MARAIASDVVGPGRTFPRGSSVIPIPRVPASGSLSPTKVTGWTRT